MSAYLKLRVVSLAVIAMAGVSLARPATSQAATVALGTCQLEIGYCPDETDMEWYCSTYCGDYVYPYFCSDGTLECTDVKRP